MVERTKSDVADAKSETFNFSGKYAGAYTLKTSLTDHKPLAGGEEVFTCSESDSICSETGFNLSSTSSGGTRGGPAGARAPPAAGKS
ncbi:hypothetical protein M5689_020622 [Euphorbia peplus]|nr:hypothetical protein M5689_020622 [Euphorbia peplus]